MLLPLSGLLAGVKPRVKLLALDIPHSGNPKVRYDTVFSLGPFNIDKSLFRCPYLCYLPLSGLLAGVKPRVKLLALAIPYSGNPKVRYDTVFSLGPFNIDKSLFRCPYLCYLPLSGLLAGVKPRVKLLALAIPYSGNPKVRCDTVFSLGPFNINKSPFHCPYVVTPFGDAGSMVFFNRSTLQRDDILTNQLAANTHVIARETQIFQCAAIN